MKTILTKYKDVSESQLQHPLLPIPGLNWENSRGTEIEISVTPSIPQNKSEGCNGPWYFVCIDGKVGVYTDANGKRYQSLICHHLVDIGD